MRRLRNDLAALERLRSESSVFRFVAQGEMPQHYQISFQGKGLWRDRGKIRFHELHRIEIKLGASYPRTMPEIRWLTPIYHPNISEIGMVCLGGYGTHWVPSVQLDELCVMLWDMLRYHNYDIRSPYNRDAALWVAHQTAILFPTDTRPLRDLRAALGRVASSAADEKETPVAAPTNGAAKTRPAAAGSDASTTSDRVWRFVGRYGRVFQRAENADSRTADQPAPASPSNPELQALVSAEIHSGPAGGTDRSAGHDEELVIFEPTHSAPTAPAPAPGLAPAAMAAPAPAPAPAPVPAMSDEIIFIE